MLYPQAYHISWSTYGQRLHGSSKPHVDRKHNTFEGPLAPVDPSREAAARARMRYEPVRLTVEQRKIVAQSIHELCARYGWAIHAMAIQSNHCHVVVTACRYGESLRDALKAVATRTLNARYGRRYWWVAKGSARYCWERSYFLNARKYVEGQNEL